MPEIIVKYKSARALQALQDFAKYFDIIIEKPAKKKAVKPQQSADLPIRYAKKPDANALSGIWKDNPKTLEQIRKKAWGNRL